MVIGGVEVSGIGSRVSVIDMEETSHRGSKDISG